MSTMERLTSDVQLNVNSFTELLMVCIKCNSDNRVIFNQSYNLGGLQSSNSLMFLFFMPLGSSMINPSSNPETSMPNPLFTK